MTCCIKAIRSVLVSPFVTR